MNLWAKASYQVLQLHEDDLSVGAQDLFVVTSTFRARVGQQENRQDTTQQSSAQTLETTESSSSTARRGDALTSRAAPRVRTQKPKRGGA